MSLLRLTSIWCIPAAASDAVLILARYADDRIGWTHLMRWTPGRAPEPGAWALLRLSRRWCRVDSTGEFLWYHAQDPFGGPWNRADPRPFSASRGGAWAISRSPWLSALTDIEGAGYDGRGGGPSVHALPPKDQRKLKGMFLSTFGGFWFQRQQQGWTRVAGSGDAEDVDPWCGELTASRTSRVLQVRVPSHREGGTPVFSWRDARGEVRPMPGVAWARLCADGRLLWATRDGRVRSGKPRENAAPSGGWEAEWMNLEDHDCSQHEPKPGPSPDWARQRL